MTTPAAIPDDMRMHPSAVRPDLRKLRDWVRHKKHEWVQGNAWRTGIEHGPKAMRPDKYRAELQMWDALYEQLSHQKETQPGKNDESVKATPQHAEEQTPSADRHSQ